MARVQSEYNVEALLIERLRDLGYDYIKMSNLIDIKDNFRKCFCKVNENVLIEKKGSADLSDEEFMRVMTRVNNHTVYESASGQQVYLTNQMGLPFPVKVTAKTEKTITFDTNHEMAGKELNFKIELVEVK